MRSGYWLLVPKFHTEVEKPVKDVALFRADSVIIVPAEAAVLPT